MDDSNISREKQTAAVDSTVSPGENVTVRASVWPAPPFTLRLLKVSDGRPLPVMNMALAPCVPPRPLAGLLPGITEMPMAWPWPDPRPPWPGPWAMAPHTMTAAPRMLPPPQGRVLQDLVTTPCIECRPQGTCQHMNAAKWYIGNTAKVPGHMCSGSDRIALAVNGVTCCRNNCCRTSAACAPVPCPQSCMLASTDHSKALDGTGCCGLPGSPCVPDRHWAPWLSAQHPSSSGPRFNEAQPLDLSTSTRGWVRGGNQGNNNRWRGDGRAQALEALKHNNSSAWTSPGLVPFPGPVFRERCARRPECAAGCARSDPGSSPRGAAGRVVVGTRRGAPVEPQRSQRTQVMASSSRRPCRRHASNWAVLSKATVCSLIDEVVAQMDDRPTAHVDKPRPERSSHASRISPELDLRDKRTAKDAAVSSATGTRPQQGPLTAMTNTGVPRRKMTIMNEGRKRPSCIFREPGILMTTKEPKGTQCWVALNKGVVYDIVESALLGANLGEDPDLPNVSSSPKVATSPSGKSSRCATPTMTASVDKQDPPQTKNDDNMQTTENDDNSTKSLKPLTDIVSSSSADSPMEVAVPSPLSPADGERPEAPSPCPSRETSEMSCPSPRSAGLVTPNSPVASRPHSQPALGANARSTSPGPSTPASQIDLSPAHRKSNTEKRKHETCPSDGTDPICKKVTRPSSDYQVASPTNLHTSSPMAPSPQPRDMAQDLTMRPKANPRADDGDGRVNEIMQIKDVRLADCDAMDLTMSPRSGRRPTNERAPSADGHPQQDNRTSRASSPSSPRHRSHGDSDAPHHLPSSTMSRAPHRQSTDYPWPGFSSGLPPRQRSPPVAPLAAPVRPVHPDLACRQQPAIDPPGAHAGLGRSGPARLSLHSLPLGGRPSSHQPARAASAPDDRSSGTSAPSTCTSASRDSKPAMEGAVSRSCVHVNGTPHVLFTLNAATSPGGKDSRASPRLGWVAVSKQEVHTIVDSVMEAMLADDDGISKDTSGSATSAQVNSERPMSEDKKTSSDVVVSKDIDQHFLPITNTDQMAGPSESCLVKGERPSPCDTPSDISTSDSTKSALDSLPEAYDLSSRKVFKWKSSLLERMNEESASPATSPGLDDTRSEDTASPRSDIEGSDAARTGKQRRGKRTPTLKVL